MKTKICAARDAVEQAIREMNAVLTEMKLSEDDQFTIGGLLRHAEIVVDDVAFRACLVLEQRERP